MRFISPHGNYRIVVIHDKLQFDADGYTRTVQPGYTVEFKQNQLTPYERKLAAPRSMGGEEMLQFPGGVTDRVNRDGSPYEYISLAGVFDTEWIDEAATWDGKPLRAEIEKRLLNWPGLGNPNDFILVEQPRQPAPWPAYDELKVAGKRTAVMVAERNLETAEATGVPIEDLISYEIQEGNREAIIEVYRMALAGTPEPEEVIVTA